MELINIPRYSRFGQGNRLLTLTKKGRDTRSWMSVCTAWMTSVQLKNVQHMVTILWSLYGILWHIDAYGLFISNQLEICLPSGYLT